MPVSLMETRRPTLRGILADPIIQAVMARDGLTRAEVLATIRRARIRMADKRRATSRSVSKTSPESAPIEDADPGTGHACERRLQWNS